MQRKSKTTILFLCPHGAAKSVIAANLCRRLAQERSVEVEVAFAGTEPDETIAPAVAARLIAEGFDLTGQQPRLVSAADLAAADRIVSLGCDIEPQLPVGANYIRWNDVPPPSQNLDEAYRLIMKNVAQILNRLEGGG